MKKKILRTIATLVAAAAFALTFVAPASAITGGERDGARHPNVGLILFYDAKGRYRCSATLVSPTIVLTAAHCTIGTLGKTGVTFKSEIAEQGPSPFPFAADPSAGYTDAELQAMGMLSGTAYTHPNYSNFTDLRNWNDVGVIVLDEPVAGIIAAPLPPRGFLGAYAQPKLNSTLFTVVGYGTEVRKPVSGPQQPQPMSYPLVRRVTTSPGRSSQPRSCSSTASSTTSVAAAGRVSGTRAARCSSTDTSSRTRATATRATAATSAATSDWTSRASGSGWRTSASSTNLPRPPA